MIEPTASTPLFRADLPPSELSDELDAFGHRDYAVALASVLREASSPFTLGLFGPWGVGKTTVIEEVGRQIAPDAAFAYFDVWRYEGDALRRQFLRDLAGQLHPDEADFDPKVELTDLDEATSVKVEKLRGLSGDAFRETLLRSAIAAITVFVLLQLVGSDLRTEEGVIRDVVISAALGLLLFVLTPLTRIFRVTEQTLTRSRLEDPEHFTERFLALLQSLKKDRLVVAFDNLDRCSPDRVEELLTTLKTYLEPLAQPTKTGLLARLFGKSPSTKEAVFLIAADDEALRRHLEAKEWAASTASTQKAGLPAGAPRDVVRYVDEYLRKFFTTTMRIRPLLDADMKAYAAQELSGFSQAHDLDKATVGGLVEMVAAALSRNPRRIKQFANNLETRFRVIKQREAAEHIHPPISDQLLVIAKLAILEEEWPRSFAALHRNPRALDEWQAAVVAGQPVAAPDEDERDFVRFLSRSRDVRAENLSAFLSLKQSPDEIGLRRYGDFRAALDLGTAEEVEAILVEELEHAAEYAEHLPAILEEELERDNIEGGRAVVEIATSVPALAQQEDVVRTVLRRAVGDARLRPRLAAARTDPLFRAGLLLDAADQRRLFAEFLELGKFLEESPARLSSVLSSFASIADSLPQETSDGLRQALRQPPIASQIEALLPLVLRSPATVPVEPANAALAELGSEFDVDSTAFSFVSAWLKGGQEATALENELLAQFAQVVNAQRTAVTSDEAEAKRVLEAIRVPAEGLRSAEASAVQSLFESLDVSLDSWAESTWPALLDLLATIAARSPEAGQPVLARLVSEFFAAAASDAIAYAARGSAAVPATLHGPLLAHLSATAAGEVEDVRVPAFEAIVALDPADATGTAKATIETAIGRSLFFTANRFIKHDLEVIAPSMEELLGKALEVAQAETRPQVLRRAFMLLLAQRSFMSDAQWTDFVALLAASIQSNDDDRVEEAATVIRQLAEDDSAIAHTQQVVHQAFDDIKSTPARPALLAFVAENIELLKPMEVGAFVAHLATMIRDLEQRPAALAAVQALPELDKPAHRRELVDALIDVEIMEAEAPQRIDLLRLAGEVASARGTAAKLLRERLASLEKSADETDREVHRAVTRQRDEAVE